MATEWRRTERSSFAWSVLRRSTTSYGRGLQKAISPCVPRGPSVRVIQAIDGAIVSGSVVRQATVRDGLAVADPGRDLLKMTVVNRYLAAPPAVAFVEGFGLKRGAIASSVAHDSHNIITVGVDDEALAAAVDAIGRAGGGVAAVDGSEVRVQELPGRGTDERRGR